jgi:DNA repair protein RecO (recombination protein O)
MLVKSPAIVLGSVKYGDSSIILKTYTRELGLKSFIAGGVPNKKGVIKPSFVQPLSQLSLVFYEKSKGGTLKRIKEASVYQPYNHLFYNPVKSTVALFLAEVLSHVLQEEEPEPSLFDFIADALMVLDELNEGLGNFHLAFLFKLTNYLGFKPESVTGESHYFDLLNGVYTSYEPPHYHFLDTEVTPHWKKLQALEMDTLDQLKPGKALREKLLTALLEYYRLHSKDFGKLRSLEVVKTILS